MFYDVCMLACFLFSSTHVCYFELKICISWPNKRLNFSFCILSRNLWGQNTTTSRTSTTTEQWQGQWGVWPTAPPPPTSWSTRAKPAIHPVILPPELPTGRTTMSTGTCPTTTSASPKPQTMGRWRKRRSREVPTLGSTADWTTPSPQTLTPLRSSRVSTGHPTRSTTSNGFRLSDNSCCHETSLII